MDGNQLIRELEEELLNPGTRKSTEELTWLISDDFYETGSSGKVYTREEVIAALKNETTQNITIEEFRTINLSADIITAYYVAVKNGAVRSRRCSIWKKTDDRWQIYYHQGTNIS